MQVSDTRPEKEVPVNPHCRTEEAVPHPGAAPAPRPPHSQATTHTCAWREGTEPTWGPVLKLLLLVVIDNDVCFHRYQLLLVKLTKVEQGQLIKLLVAEENL